MKSERQKVAKLDGREVDRINETRKTTLLSKLSVEEVGQVFERATCENGNITQEALEKALAAHVRGKGLAHQTHVARTVKEIMAIFDRNGDGIINGNEFLVGMSILCKGTQEQKVYHVFRGLDKDGDGHITLDEMIEYMISFFQTTFTVSQTTLQKGISPMKLGYATALACFEEADANHDGKITFDEFRNWYTKQRSKGGVFGQANSAKNNAT